MAYDDEDVEFQGAGAVERATRAELRALKVSMRTSTLAATMVSLARRIDYARGAASAAQAAAQLRETRAVLIEERDRQPQGDLLDELNARRAERRPDGVSAAAAVERPAKRPVRGKPGPGAS